MRRRTFLHTASAVAASGMASLGSTTEPANTKPFLGSWLNLHHLHPNLDKAKGQRAIDECLDGHLKVGLQNVMPFVTSTAGGAYFPSQTITQRPQLGWDPLEHLINGANERGLAVYPAFSTLVCGHLKPSGVLLERLEWASRHPDGKPMGHICPTHPGARDWVTSVVSEVVKRYPIQGIMLDYLRYYNRPSRLDAASEAEFSRWVKGRNELTEKTALQAFREEGISKLAQQISETARDLRPHLKVAIYSWGPHVADNHQVAQPWPRWSRDGLIDQVSISGYCYPDNYGDDYLDVFRRRLGDSVKLNERHEGRAQVTFSLGIRTSHGTIRNASWIRDYLDRAAEQGIEGVNMFTWAYLQPYLQQTIRNAYVAKFAARIAG